MILFVNGAKYFVKFHHNTVAKGTSVRGTVCTISKENGDIINDGVATVHPKDHNYDKEKGRQISLSRAISTWDKSSRTEVWNAYRTWGKARF